MRVRGLLHDRMKHRERMAMIEMGMHPDYPVLEREERVVEG